MKKPSLVQFAFGVAFIAFIVTIGASLQSVSAQDCSKVTPDEILKDVTSLMEADSKLGPQMEHINISVVYRAVIFFGYTLNKGDDIRAQYIGLRGKCVLQSNINKLIDFVPTPGNDPYNMLRAPNGTCSAGTKPCGDICIPEGDSCNIKSRASAED